MYILTLLENNNKMKQIVLVLILSQYIFAGRSIAWVSSLNCGRSDRLLTVFDNSNDFAQSCNFLLACLSRCKRRSRRRNKCIQAYIVNLNNICRNILLNAITCNGIVQSNRNIALANLRNSYSKSSEDSNDRPVVIVKNFNDLNNQVSNESEKTDEDEEEEDDGNNGGGNDD